MYIKFTWVRVHQHLIYNIFLTSKPGRRTHTLASSTTKTKTSN